MLDNRGKIEEVISLNGGWEFYWNRLLLPGEISGEERARCEYFNIPRTWNGVRSGGKKISGQGFATFRCIIKSVEPGSAYGFHIHEMGSAYSLRADGNVISSNGTVGKSHDTMKPCYLPRSVRYVPSKDSIELVLQISNFYDNSGGPWGRIRFGPWEKLYRESIFTLSVNIFLISTLFIISLYHLLIFVFIRRDLTWLYFSLFCLLMSIRTAIMGERLFIFINPEFNWETALKIEHLTAYIGFPVYLQFFYLIFGQYMRRSVIRAGQSLCLFIAAVTLFVPARIHTILVNPFQVIIIFSTFYIIAVLISAFNKKEEGSGLLLAGCIIITGFAINDILHDHGIISTGFFLSHGFFIFILFHSILLAKRYAKAFTRVERLSRELSNERDHFEQKVYERTDELIKTNNRLRELDQAKNRFISNISHEIRTPLTLILSPIEAVLNGIYKGKIDHKFFQGLHRHSVSLLDQINDLLDLNRLADKKMPVNMKTVNLNELVEESVSTMKGSASDRSLDLFFSPPPSTVKTEADYPLLKKAINNLLVNAIKFTPAGGKISVCLEYAEDNVMIKVRDTGIGIPEDKIDIIFDHFSQVDDSSTRPYRGSGIGLALVKEIAILHKGEITVQSELGKGSVFTLKIPAYSSSITSPVYKNEDAVKNHIIISPPDIDVLNNSYMRVEAVNNTKESVPEHLVLIVEDDEDMMSFLISILGDSYRLITAKNGKDAADLLHSTDELPDIILSDIMLPKITGLDMTRLIKQDDALKEIPVILLTARADICVKLEGFSIGAVDYITKPFHPTELLARIKSQLELKLMRDRLAKSNQILYDRLKEKFNSCHKEITETAEEKLNKVIEFIRENYTADISREGMASIVEMSPDFLSSVFNKKMGKRIDTYINELRIAEARCQLEETGKSITRIAFDIGYNDVRTFNRAFKTIVGMTPSEYLNSLKHEIVLSVE